MTSWKKGKSGKSSKSGKSNKSDKDDDDGGSNDDDDGDDDDDGCPHHDDDDDTCTDPDGQTVNDIIISENCRFVQLRAERQGGGNGRVYTITLQAKDSAGNMVTAECKVEVPIDPYWPVVDDGAGAGYTVECEHNQPRIASRRDTGVKLVLDSTEEAAAETTEEVGDTEIASNDIEELFTKPVTPTEFSLRSNYPNPFNPSTVIAYDIPEQAHVTLEVYNLLGQVVIRLVDGVKPPGAYTVTWNAHNKSGHQVASGIYLYRIVTSIGDVETKRMTLLK